MESLEHRAKAYALKCHADTNHLYDGKPYYVHLNAVVAIAKKFEHLLPPDKREIIVAACYTHDVIEDTRQTYNDVKAVLGEEVANLAYALTNEKGRNRKERANSKYYNGIIQTPFAVFIKLCDRIANVEYSASKKENGMFAKYKEEHNDFLMLLYQDHYAEMFNYLYQVFKDADVQQSA